MFKQHVRNSLFVFFLLIFCLLSNYPCLADAEISGLENPEKKPLYFVSIVLEDGSNANEAGQVPLNPRFKLEFSKNVVNDSIWENNKNCFKLSDPGGKNIPLTVSRINDTVDFEQRDFIFIQVSSQLKPGTQYQLHILPALVAKNLNSLGSSTDGEGVVINFKTAAIATEKETNEAVVPESDNKDLATPEEKQVEDKSGKNAETPQVKEEVQLPASEEVAKDSTKQESTFDSTEEKETKEQITSSLNEKEDSQAESSKDFPEENKPEATDNNNTALWITALGVLAIVSILFYLKFKR